MSDDTRPNITPRLVMGALILLVGVVLTLQNFGLFHVGNLFDFWPLVLVGIGLSKILRPARPASRVWGSILLVLGVVFQLDELDLAHVDLSVLFPIVLVAVGLYLVWRALGRRSETDTSQPESVSRLSEWAAFGGGDRQIASEDFQGGDVTVVFGGYDLDLRNARLVRDQAVIDVFAMFGGVELKVPESWSCRADGVAIFGGFDDKSAHPADEGAKKLVVRGWAIFGGVEVRN